MKDPNGTKIGIISNSTRKGTSIVDTETDQWPQNFPPVNYLKYELVDGAMVATVKIRFMPARIKGIITSVQWLRHNAQDEWEVAEDYVPTREQDLVGRRMHFECDGVFAHMIPLDDQTRAIFKCCIRHLAWESAPGEVESVSLHLTCLLMPHR